MLFDTLERKKQEIFLVTGNNHVVYDASGADRPSHRTPILPNDACRPCKTRLPMKVRNPETTMSRPCSREEMSKALRHYRPPMEFHSTEARKQLGNARLSSHKRAMTKHCD